MMQSVCSTVSLWGSFRIFSKILVDIRSSRCTPGVVDTGGKWKKSSIRKIFIISFGHLLVVELAYRYILPFILSCQQSDIVPTVSHRCHLHRWQICHRCRWFRWQIATGVVVTGGKFAAVNIDTGGKFATSINKTSKTGGKICHCYRWYRQFCHRCHWYRSCALNCAYLLEFSKKFKTVLI